jgi:hypothetical protein
MQFKSKGYRLNIRVFFFNAKTDYLPYYKNFSFRIDKGSGLNLRDILKMIKAENENFAFPKNRELIFRVNDLVVNGKESVDDVVDKFGLEWRIEPVLKYRSLNCLIIDNRDFLHQFRRVLGHFSKKDDLMFYLKLYNVHYASETFLYNHEYIGDAILLLAHKMLKENNPRSREIIEAISNEFNGIDWCEYQNNIFDGRDYSREIGELKEIVYSYKKKVKKGLFNISNLLKKEREYNIGSLENRNIGVYLGNNSRDLLDRAKSKLKQKRARFVEFAMENRLAGQTILDINPDFAYKKAGRVMLEAFDNGIEVLACVNREDYNYFKEVHYFAEKRLGREINLDLMPLDI